MAADKPRRRCVGCGRVAEKSELLRIALAGARDAAVIDLQAVLPGRGAYLCRSAEHRDRPRSECAALALRRRAIPRALRANAPLDLELVESMAR